MATPETFYPDPEPMHEFFELSYASYLVIPRTLLQSISPETQQKLRDALDAAAAEEREHRGHCWPGDARITVQLRNEKGRFIKDPLADYERGRRRLWGKTTK